MPEISRFYGIVIKMYFQKSEHNPPHIHAFYQDYIVAISINDLTILFSLSLIVVIIITICLALFLFVFIMYGTSSQRHQPVYSRWANIK